MAAAERAQHYRALFPTIEATAAVLKRYERQQSSLESIDTGIALGFVGDAGAARRMFARYTSRERILSGGLRSTRFGTTARGS